MSFLEDKERVAVLHQVEGNRFLSSQGRKFCPWVKCRVVITLMTFLGLINLYALRVNLSMAIVVMANDTHRTNHQHLKTTGKTKVYDWTETQQGWLLGAFFCGYIITHIPGGWLAQRFGAKYVLGIGILMTAVLTLFTPLAADLGIWVLIAVRVLEGLFEGVTFPSVNALFGVWVPPTERGRLVVLAYSGQFVGSFISFPLTALLSVYGFAGGWPSAFYVFGSVGVVWFVLWVCLVYSSPATHPRISFAERNYIETSIADARRLCDDKKNVSTPWLAIFTSSALWGIVVAQFCSAYGFYVLLTTMPTYFAQALGFNLGNDLVMNGVYSSITYAVQFVIALFVGPLSDVLSTHYLSPTITRKLLTCSSLCLSATFLLLASYFGQSRPLAVALVTLGNGFGALVLGGHVINAIELAPRFSGIVFGIVNVAGTLAGIIAPVIAKAIAHSNDAPRSVYIEEWREVFILAAEVYLFGAAIYAILGDSKKQWWANGALLQDKKLIN